MVKENLYSMSCIFLISRYTYKIIPVQNSSFTSKTSNIQVRRNETDTHDENMNIYWSYSGKLLPILYTRH